MISVKTEEEVGYIKKSGKILAEVFREIKRFIRPGIVTAEIDKRAERLIFERGAAPAFLGYRGYKYATCISVNEEVVHGIPGRKALKEGDIVGVDIGVILDGWYSDRAMTYAVGEISKKAKKLISATKEALKAGIKQAQAGKHLGDIGAAIDSCARKAGFTVVRDLFGHGIGRNLHEDPLIPNYGNPGEGPKLKKGMVFAIEPMLNTGGHQIKTLEDGWTVVTADSGLSAHFEHTIVVKEGKAEILTNG